MAYLPKFKKKFNAGTQNNVFNLLRQNYSTKYDVKKKNS